MEIKKFNYVFGINRLFGCELMQKNTLIYAPNGTMKSSFADGIISIINGSDPSEINHPKTADYEIIQGTTRIDQNSPAGLLNAIVLRGENDGVLFNNSVSLTIDPNLLLSLALSDPLKKKMVDLQKREKDLEDDLVSIYETATQARKGTGTSVLKALGGDQANHFEFLTLINDSDFELASQISNPQEIDLKALSASPVQKAAISSDFSQNAFEYGEYLDKQYNEPGFFDQQFSINDLKELSSTAETMHYFSSKRSFYLNGRAYSKADIDILVDNAIQDVYGTAEAMKKFVAVKSVLSKAKNLQQFKETVEQRKDLIPLMVDYPVFLRALFVAKINNKEKLLSLRRESQEIHKGYLELQSLAEKEKTGWNETINTFNDRFSSNGFTARLAQDKMIFPSGISKIEIISKSDQTPCSDALRVRLSTGEKDSLWILNCLFKIQEKTDPTKELAIVLDDIADAFDYKNKYAITEYMLDLCKKPNYSIFILTHSFDFYKTVSLALRNLSVPLIAYKNQLSMIGGDVTLVQCSDPAYQSLVGIDGWKNIANVICVFSLLPIIRSLEQISAGTSTISLISELDSFVHYGITFKNGTIQDLKDLFSKTHFGMKTDSSNPSALVPISGFGGVNLSDSLYSALWDATGRINGSGDLSTKLVNRIAVGFFIRISIERVLFQILTLHSIQIPILGNGYANAMLSLLPPNDLLDPRLQHYKESLWIGNCFVHANSMIDAPLVDVGPDELNFLNGFYHSTIFSKLG